ncbi:MAG TPA: alpha/beta hydrolase family protein [Thermoleophilaceae bacterium]|nr:alpha/beta hydrolase family protein [Thermoleophilaceae bacterium]
MAVCLAGALAPAAARAAAPAFRDGHGLRVVSVTQVDPRLVNVKLSTAALTGQPNVRILLPAGYASNPNARYPVIYLIHGTSGRASDWTTMGDAEKTVGNRPVIVVMPDIGIDGDGGGWCTNWWNDGRGGKPMWETFHIDQLIPWVDANLRTVANRDGRAIFGLSQGGFCALSYAARHPDLFVSAGSFSGADDIAAHGAIADPLVTPVIQATAVALDHVPPDSFFGPRASEEINWAAHDPATLAGNLRGMNLYAFTGNGQPGPLDPPVPNSGAITIEAGAHELTQLFHDTLTSLGIPIHYDDYGPGTHTWPYWARDFRQVIDSVMHDFAAAPPLPRPIRYQSADPSYSAWGWRVNVRRPAREFSTLAGASARGFSLSGSGSATVVTPALYGKRARLVVRIASPAERRSVRLRADRRGRLRVSLRLGPGNPFQEFTPQAAAAGTKVYTAKVSARRRSH